MFHRSQIIRLFGVVSGILLWIGIASAAPKQDTSLNQIEKIDRQEEDNLTRLQIHCSKEPTFTVFRLHDPVRVIIDVIDAKTQGSGTAFTVQNGVIDQIAHRTFSRDGQSIGRITIGLYETTAYDVKRNGNTIELLIDAAKRRQIAPTDTNEAIEIQRRELKQLQTQITSETKKIDSLLSDREQLSAKQEKLQEQVERLESQRAHSGKLQQTVSRHESRLADLQAKMATSVARHGALRNAVATIRRLENDQAQLAKELKSARSDQTKARTTLIRVNRELDQTRSQLEKRETTLVSAQSKLDKLRTKNNELSDRVNKAETDAETANTRLRTAREESDESLAKADKRIRSLTTRISKAKKRLARTQKTGQGYALQTEKLGKLQANLRKQLAQEKTLRTERETALKNGIQELKKAQTDLEGALGQQKKHEKRVRKAYEERITKLEARLVAQKKLRETQKLAARARAILEARSMVTSELEQLMKKRDKTAKVVTRLTQKRQQYETEIKTIESTIKTRRTEVRTAEKKQKKALTKLDTLNTRIGKAETKIQDLDTQRSELRTDLSQLRQQTGKLQKKRMQHQQNIQDLEDKNQILTAHVDELQTSLGALTKRMDTERQQHDVTVAGMSAERTVLKKKIHFLEQGKSQNNAQVETLQSKVKTLSENLQGAEQSYRQTIQAVEKERAELRNEVTDLQTQITGNSSTFVPNEQVAQLRVMLAAVQQTAADERDAVARRAKSEVQQYQTEITRLNKILVQAKAQPSTHPIVSSLQNHLVSAREQLKKAETILIDRSKEAVTARESAAEANAESERLRSEIKSLQSQLDNAGTARELRVQSLETQLGGLRTQLKKQRHVTSKKTKYEKQKMQVTVQRLETELAKLRSQLHTERTEKHAVQETAQKVKQKSEKLALKANEFRTKSKELKANAERLKNEARKLRTKIEQLEQSDQGQAAAKLRKFLNTAERAARISRAKAASMKAAAQKWQSEANRSQQAKERAMADKQRAQVLAQQSLDEVQRLRSQTQNLRAKLKMNGTATIKDIRFESPKEGPRVVITANQAFEYDITERGSHLDLRIRNAELPNHLERILDTRAFDGPIAEIATYGDSSDSSIVHVRVTRSGESKGGIISGGKQLVWAFKPNSPTTANTAPMNGKARWGVHGVASASYNQQPGGPPAAGPGGGSSQASSSPAGGNYQYIDPYFGRRRKKRKYRGRKINLTIKDADILHVLTFLAKEGNINIITSEEVVGTVSFHFENIPWDLALEMVLKSKGLAYRQEESVYRIALADSIQKEYEREAEIKKKVQEFKQLIVKLIPLSYADAKKVAERVAEILSTKGTVGVDERTNTLIVKDVEEHILAAEDLVHRLDTQTPQVLIEARIVEATDTFARELGVQFGGTTQYAPIYGNETGLMFPGVVGLSGGADDPLAPEFGILSSDAPNFAINMPATAGLGSGGALSLSLASINGASTLNLRLSAAEEQGKVKIISSPRVSTMDNVQASIEQGVSIPISVVSANGVNTQFFQADLKLDVTPHVTPDSMISMKVDIQKNEPDFGQRGSSGNPTIQRKEAHTQLLVKDGETAVIGGIFTRNTSIGVKRIPILGSLPLLGWMFRNKQKTDKRSELLIFITPRIVNREASRPKTDR